MSLYGLFERPLLIYDDKCYSCMKFAKTASTLSRGWIRTAGHYYSEEARKAKEMVFPKGYDPTAMFWLINTNGAHGARGGLLPLAGEIIKGMFKGGQNTGSFIAQCEYAQAGQNSNASNTDATPVTMSCYTPTNVVKRLFNTLKKSTHFYFSVDG